MFLTKKLKRYRDFFRLLKEYSRADKIVWDLDGTLYFSPVLIDRLRKKYVRYYVSRGKEPEKNFLELESRGEDWINIIQGIESLSQKKLISNIERGIVKHQYVDENLRLVEYFAGSSKKHFLFTNSDRKETLNALYKLGVQKPSGVFSRIITMDDLEELKPSKNSFNLLLKALGGVGSGTVIYIGDSAKQDINPARKLGFKTIFINNWGANNVGHYNYNDINLLIHDFIRAERILRFAFIKYLMVVLL